MLNSCIIPKYTIYVLKLFRSISCIILYVVLLYINRIYLYAILFVCVIKLALPILGTVLPSLPGYRISYSLGYDTYLLRYTTAVLAIKDAIYLFQRTELFYFIT